MNEDDFFEKPRLAAGAKQSRTVPYTSKDFQLEVLGQLGEVQTLTRALHETVRKEIKTGQDFGKLLRFDGRTLVAIGAIALSITGYILQDARNTSKRDAEIETTKARVSRLEESSVTNTEGRVRTEVQIG